MHLRVDGFMCCTDFTSLPGDNSGVSLLRNLISESSWTVRRASDQDLRPEAKYLGDVSRMHSMLIFLVFNNCGAKQ